ncbi:MAG: hypothetical protein JXA06_05115 [Bacteroidetes bacterium]|nr:hypothetical protein [Bacteroidota bacterium]
MDPLLYGHNPEERIVAVHQLNDQTIRLFKRVEGKIIHRDVEFFPFFFLSDESLIKEFPKKFWLKRLAGSNFYQFIAAFSRWSEMWEAIHFILRQYNKNHLAHISSFQELKEILVRNEPVRQFLLQSGITLFKGMEFNDLLRLSIDIQYAPPKSRKQDGINKPGEKQINIITLLTNKNKKYILKTVKQNEHDLLERCVRQINEIDPDVIEGSDLYGTILPALSRASERHHIPLTIGRDGSDMRMPGGPGETEWYSFDVFGRHLVDISAVAEAKINTRRSDQSLSLFALAKHYGIPYNSKKTSSLSGTKGYKPASKELADQSLQNAVIGQQISNLLLPPLFYLAQICPFNFRMLIFTGATSRIESLMLREYVRQKHSVPKPMEGSRNISIPAEIYRAGVFSDVDYIELEGLYASVILRQNIRPRTDHLNIFPSLLQNLNSLKGKLLAEKNGSLPQKKNDGMRIDSLSHLLDSFQISLGHAKCLFNDPDEAEAIVSISRDILKEIIRQIELFNAVIIQSDDRGFFLLMPDNIIGDVNITNFIERLSNTLPAGISLVRSCRYRKMLSYRKSNYAVLDQKDNLLIKGNSLITRGMEHFLRIFVQRFIECMITNDFNRLHHLYATVYTQIVKHAWTPADFCRTEIAKTDTETYRNEVAAGRITPSPALEAAVRSSLFVKANSRIAYYISGTEKDANITDSSKLAEEWNPLKTDENTAYYLTRLHEAVNKFKEFFEQSALDRILSLDGIFGFSNEGIRILERKTIPETTDVKSDAEEYGIWLAERD